MERPRIKLPAGKYELTGPIEITGGVIFEGSGIQVTLKESDREQPKS